MAGEGSIYPVTVTRPDGTTRTAYRAQLSLGGRTDRRYVRRTCRTKTEAKAALRAMLADRDAGRDLSKLSLGAYLRRWLAETVAPSVAANTLRGYEDAIAHLAPIGDVPVAALRPEDIERTLAGMTTRRVGAKAQPASAKTVRNVQIVLRHALGTAEDRGHVRHNVARLVPLRRVPRPTREPLTPADARAILAAIAGDRYEAAYALALLGLRQGEVLGLAWSDVTPAGVSVRQRLAGSGRTARMAQLKTAGSAGTIPLPPFVRSRLDAHETRMKAERRVVSLDGGLVFVTERGYAVNGSWLTKHFQSLLAAAGLPRLRLHDLRHGAASLLVAAGAHPRVAQELLRHSSSRTTMDIYAHVNAGQRDEAVALLETAVTEESPGESPKPKAGTR